MDIQKIYKQLQSAINLLDMLEEVLISGIRVSGQEIQNSVGNGVLMILPDIVDSYELVEMQEFKEEIHYWSNQLDRIIEAVNKEDTFFLIDVLMRETRESLSEYQNRIEELFHVSE